MKPAMTAELVRPSPMLSRVANSLYWMSRYIERAENTARLVDTSLQLLLDIRNLDEEHVAKQWLPIVQAAGDEEAFSKLHPKATGAAVTEFLVFQAENPNSIVQCICEARENARMVRDQITFELWEELNRLYLFVKSREARQVWRQSPSDFFSEIKAASMHLTGIATPPSSTMKAGGSPRPAASWNAPTRPRAFWTCAIKAFPPLRAFPARSAQTEALEWSAILRSCSAWDAYKSINGADVHPVLVAEFLVLSEDFPRSIRFCAAQLNTALRKFPACPRAALSTTPNATPAGCWPNCNSARWRRFSSGVCTPTWTICKSSSTALATRCSRPIFSFRSPPRARRILSSRKNNSSSRICQPA
jgi:uncharacterized alpha-E superfamily protein